VETRGHIIEIDAKGILRSWCKPGTQIDLDEAKEVVRQMAGLCAGHRRTMLVDMSNLRSITRDARQYFAGAETAELVTAGAMLVTSPLARVVGNFFIGFNKTASPIRLFTSEHEALEWLAGFG